MRKTRGGWGETVGRVLFSLFARFNTSALYSESLAQATACLAHAPKKCTQSGILQFDINATFQNSGSLYTRAYI